MITHLSCILYTESFCSTLLAHRRCTASLASQRLPNWPETAWTRWWVQSQTSGRREHRGLRGSLCETKQSTSCSVEPGRSFWLQFCLDRPQQSPDTERAARGDATHASAHACLLTRTRTQLLRFSCTTKFSSVAEILEAYEGTSWHIGKRKLCVNISHIVTNCVNYSGYLWLMASI